MDSPWNISDFDLLLRINNSVSTSVLKIDVNRKFTLLLSLLLIMEAHIQPLAVRFTYCISTSVL